MRIWLWVDSAHRNLKHLGHLIMRCTRKDGDHETFHISLKKLCWKWVGKSGVNSSAVPSLFFLFFAHPFSLSPSLLVVFPPSAPSFASFLSQTSLQISGVTPADTANRKQPHSTQNGNDKWGGDAECMVGNLLYYSPLKNCRLWY